MPEFQSFHTKKNPKICAAEATPRRSALGPLNMVPHLICSKDFLGTSMITLWWVAPQFHGAGKAFFCGALKPHSYMCDPVERAPKPYQGSRLLGWQVSRSKGHNPGAKRWHNLAANSSILSDPTATQFCMAEPLLFAVLLASSQWCHFRN